jgi:glutathione synthase/RimK-type ligase-like ATP-grasp enzyme
MRLAFLSPVPEYEENWSHIKTDYVRLFGDDTAFVDWTKANDLASFDIVTPLLAWGYPRDTATWFALLDRMEAEDLPVANPVSVLRWNSNKQYLFELADKDVPIVPTRATYALAYDDLVSVRKSFACEMLVIKPTVSGGADGTYLLNPEDPIPPNVIGKQMLVQPYFSTIATEGEYSLFYFGGIFSHSIVKRPAAGDFRVQEQFGGREEAVAAPAAALALAQASLDATAQITQTGTLAYARADMLRDGEGNFRLMELELIEPSLFLHFSPDNGAEFAKALLARD